MRRRLLNLLTALSLLLYVAAIVLWVRSYWSNDGLQWLESDMTRAWMVAAKSHKGLVVAGWYKVSSDGPVREPVAWETEACNTPTGLSRGRYYQGMPLPRNADDYGARFTGRAGFYSYSNLRTFQPYYGTVLGPPIRIEQRLVAFPYWLVTASALLLPLYRVVTAQYRWRRRSSCLRSRSCVACGYDLRATPDRCPECGTAAVRTPA